ncbi:allograft inflammatory factor 1-like, partial [Triplophysa rosa]
PSNLNPQGVSKSINRCQKMIFGVMQQQWIIHLIYCLFCEFMEDQKYRDEEDLAEKLDSFKNKYAEFDLNDQGEIDMMGLKRMMEKLGVPKTHLEMKKMISEVTGGCSDTINYRDFVKMMLGKRSAVLKLVMMFEDKANGTSCKADGPPPKRDITSLP